MRPKLFRDAFPDTVGFDFLLSAWYAAPKDATQHDDHDHDRTRAHECQLPHAEASDHFHLQEPGWHLYFQLQAIAAILGL